MVMNVDREAGVAAFREGRSLCIRLTGVLDGRMARGAEYSIREEGTAVRLRLECSALTGIDATGARLLAGTLVAWVAAADGRSAEIHNLDLAIQRRLARHPLRSFIHPDDLVFLDPDRESDRKPVAALA